MAKIYVCDSCGEPMRDPHKIKMREFYVDYTYESGVVIPVDFSRKKKVDLCEKCYKNLRYITDKKCGAERPMGTWEKGEDGKVRCSACKKKALEAKEGGWFVPDFCHSCGAYMREVEVTANV